MRSLAEFLKKKRGRAADLGRFIYGNSRTAEVAVSRWLAGKSNPNGEHVLAIIEWMDATRHHSHD